MNISRFFKRVFYAVVILLFLILAISYKTVYNTGYRKEYPEERQQKLQEDRLFMKQAYGAREVRFVSNDGIQLAGLYIERPHAARIILLSHGYGLSKEYMKRFIPLFPHDTILLFDFRAHGQSGGDWISLGAYERKDIFAAIQFLKEQPGNKDLPIIGIGVSMGGATLLGAAAEGAPFKALIIDSSFADLQEHVGHSFGIYTGLPKSLFMPVVIGLYEYLVGTHASHVKPVKDIASITCPVLVVHSEDDERTPVWNARALYDAAQKHAKNIWIAPSAKHGFIIHNYPEEYKEQIYQFLQQSE
jgi:fermentation-respiration switch protein FrsA (DUF1100 family)